MRIGFINGIHEDVIRLQEALVLLRAQNCLTIVCLGDIVGYSVPYYGFFASRNAHQAIQLVKDSCEFVVAGNHDLHAVHKIPQHQAIFDYPANWYALDYYSQKAVSNESIFLYDDELPAHLTPEDEVYLYSLPEFVVATFDNLTIMLSHYAYPDLIGCSRHFDPAVDGNCRPHFAFMRQYNCQLGLSGHALQEGACVYTPRSVQELPFGIHQLPDDPVWLHSAWVANGTHANGVLILDTVTRQVMAIPLDTPKHILPEWYER